MKWYNESLMMLLVVQIQYEPGIWTARLCRQINGLPETIESIRWCGKCADYANQRKRERAKFFRAQLVLKGFEHPFTIHPPCTVPLKRVQYLLYRAEMYELITRYPGSIIPDLCQPRGYDFGTRLEVT